MEKERKIEILKDLLIQLSDSANILCTCEADERCEVIEEYVKALEDKTIITMKKGTLKCSNQGYVVYNKDWFRKHFATEVMVMTGYDGYMEKPTSDDCVSRQAVLERINDWWGITSTSGEPSICDYIRELPSVTPTRKTGEWCKQNDDYFDWYECSECGYGSEGEMQYSSEFDVRTNYCPNCGAEMESEE